MKVKNKTIILKYILCFILIIIGIFCTKFLINTSAELTAEQLAERNVEKEKSIVRISASHSRAKEATNVINLTTLAEELNKYAGTGKTTVAEKDSSTIVVTFSATGNEYELSKASGPELPDGEKYEITYNANGGTGAPEVQTKYQGWNVELSLTVPTRDEYTFLGWAKTDSATEVEYFSGATYREDADLTLYAVWQKINTWDGELMVGSNRYEDITGGWTADGYTGLNCNAMIDQNVCYSAYATGSWYKIGTANKIDISDYKTLKFYMYAPEGTTGVHYIYCGLYNNKSDGYDVGRVAKNTSTTYYNVVDNCFEVTIDVSGVTGEYYIASYIYAQNKAISIYQVKLEEKRSLELLKTPTETWMAKQTTKSGGSDGTATVSNTSPYLITNVGEKNASYCVTKEKIDLTNYSKITITGTFTSPQYGTWGHNFFGISDGQSISFHYGDVQGIYGVGDSEFVKKFNIGNPCTETSTPVTDSYTTDISDVTGSYYVIVGTCRGELSFWPYSQITSILLEP